MVIHTNHLFVLSDNASQLINTLIKGREMKMRVLSPQDSGCKWETSVSFYVTWEAQNNKIFQRLAARCSRSQLTIEKYEETIMGHTATGTYIDQQGPVSAWSNRLMCYDWSEVHLSFDLQYHTRSVSDLHVAHPLSLLLDSPHRILLIKLPPLLPLAPSLCSHISGTMYIDVMIVKRGGGHLWQTMTRPIWDVLRPSTLHLTT